MPRNKVQDHVKKERGAERRESSKEEYVWRQEQQKMTR